MAEWNVVARENRGLAECIVVLEEYKLETENKAEVESVLRRLTDRFEWTLYTLSKLDKPDGGEDYVNPQKDVSGNKIDVD